MCYLQDTFGERVVTHDCREKFLHQGLEQKAFTFLCCPLGRQISAKQAVIIWCFIGLNYRPASAEMKTLSHEPLHLKLAGSATVSSHRFTEALLFQ